LAAQVIQAILTRRSWFQLQLLLGRSEVLFDNIHDDDPTHRKHVESFCCFARAIHAAAIYLTAEAPEAKKDRATCFGT
jgi:hypothetical protein